MIFWRILVGAMVAVMVLCIVYLLSRFHHFRCIQRLGIRHRFLSWLVCLIPLGLLSLFAMINVFTLIIVVLHLALFWALCDLFGWSWNRIRKRTIYPTRGQKKKVRRTPYYAGIMALVFCTVYLGVGWYNAHHIRQTQYSFTTEKDLQDPVRIAAIADSHLGITLDGASFGTMLEEVQQQKPDLLVIAGDFVDDDSTKEDMLEACAALGRFEAPYGIFFVFGNHDNGYYRYRDFSSQELRDALTSNGVQILEDEAVLVDDRFYVIGRQDRTAAGRAPATALTEGLDPDKYQLMLDHQPNDYAVEAESGADLVISGHTHGGHIFPAGLIGLWTHANDRTYGTEQRGNTTFLVTSGVSGWAIPFKTGTFSEYVLIDVRP